MDSIIEIKDKPNYSHPCKVFPSPNYVAKWAKPAEKKIPSKDALERITHASECESKFPGKVQPIKSATAVSGQLDRIEASDKFAKSLGLGDNRNIIPTRKGLLVIENSKNRNSGLLSFNQEIVPDPLDHISNMYYQIKNQSDVDLLKKFGFQADHGKDVITGSVFLKGIKNRKKFIDNLPLNIKVSPYLLLAVVASGGFTAITSNVKKFAARVKCKTHLPQIRVGVEIYKPNYTLSLVKPETIGCDRRKFNGKTHKLDFHKMGYIEATNVNQDFWGESLSHPKQIGILSFDYPSEKDKNNVICRVFWQDKKTKEVNFLGNIIKVDRRKVFFECEWLDSDDKDTLIHQIKHDTEHLKKREKQLKYALKQIKNREQEINHIIKTSCDMDDQILQEIKDLSNEKDSIDRELQNTRNTEFIQIAKVLWKIPRYCEKDLLDNFATLGLKPNGVLKSLPKCSPLSDPEWWQVFGYKVGYPDKGDHTSTLIVL
jgi:hypothetical protein